MCATLHHHPLLCAILCAILCAVLCAVPYSVPCVGRQYQFSAVLQGTLTFKLEQRVKLKGRTRDLRALCVKPRAEEVKVKANEVRVRELSVCVCVCV
jgi:hypothetical protein